MINLDNIILFITFISSLYFVVYNIIKRFRYTENKLFVLANIALAGLLFINLYQKIYTGTAALSFPEKYSFTLLIFICQVFVLIAQIFPKWENRPRSIFIILLQIPGLLLIAFFNADLFVPNKNLSSLILQFEQKEYSYAFIIGLYAIEVYILFIYKIIHFKNDTFKFRLMPINFALLCGAFILVIFYFILPFYFKIYEYKIFSLVGFLFVLSAINYLLSESWRIDFRKFYLKIIFRFILFAIFYFLSYLFLENVLNNDLLKNKSLFLVMAIFFPLLLIIIFLIYKFASEAIINNKNKSLRNIFNQITDEISRLSEMRTKKINWDIFSETVINTLSTSLTINKVSLFLLNEGSKGFETVNKPKNNSIAWVYEADEIIIALKKYRGIIEKSLLFTDDNLGDHKDKLLKFFNDNDIAITIPAFSYKGELIGLLFLSRLKNKKYYPPDFFFFLDIFRNQFSAVLDNLMISQDIRKTQTERRDKIIVKSIKKRIIPTRIKEIQGIKVSSLYINNSNFGGDLFDSMKIRESKIGIFLANTSDIGVESAMLSLEMSSIFHAQADMHETPEGLLNTVNQVLCTSRFTERYATAFYLIYDASSREISFSNAAFNSLFIYDPEKDNFIEFDSEGIPAGIDMGFHYKSRILNAPTNGIGICYSLGISSAINKNGNNYSPDRIRDIIRINKNDAPSELLKKAYNDFKSFIQDVKLLNDIVLIIFKTI